MPDPILRLTIRSLQPTRRGRRQGTGQARINARIQAGHGHTETFGNLRQRFRYTNPGSVNVGWQTNVNVRDVWSLWFEVTVTDTAGRRLARFRNRIWRARWRNRPREILSTRNMQLVWGLEVLAGAGGGRGAEHAIFTARECEGSTHYTTVSGRQGHMRIEFCPVMPVPVDAEMPFQPDAITRGVGRRPGWVTRNDGAVQIRANSPMNVIANPPLIPRLGAPTGRPDGVVAAATLDDAAYANERNCARIEYTWYYPNTLRLTDNDQRLVWEKLEGDGEVAFVKLNPTDANGTENKGLKVGVYGTTNGDVTLGVRFRGALVAKYRAIVGPVYKLPCRMNILVGPPGAPPDANAYRPSATPAHCAAHRAIASRVLRQIGIVLVPDPDNTIMNMPVGRTASATDQAGVFRVRVPQADTRNLTDNDAGRVTVYNYHAGVLNFSYIRSHTDGVLGCGVWWPENNAGPGGTLITDDTAPSSSWIRPSGVAPDEAAEEIEMRIADGLPHGTHADLAAMAVTSDGGNPGEAATAHNYGLTIAHELGHMMCIGHRVEEIDDAGMLADWNARTLRPAADAAGRIPGLEEGAGNLGSGDGVWCDELWHPPFENVMHWAGAPDYAIDFDRLQAKAARQSPLMDNAI